MKKLRGTALYCGIGNSIDQFKRHLEEAASVGINALFTSLQLPEADKEQLLKDFPIMAELAHKYGMVVEADISPRTSNLFGIEMKDMSALHGMGVDYARLDCGFDDEDIVFASANKNNVTVVLNATPSSRCAAPATTTSTSTASSSRWRAPNPWQCV